jgi:tRNA (guanine26-N2/guanine27-N2)-dimethyltransferase
MFEKISEGKAIFFAPVDKKISKQLPVFYNPVMEYNRSISIAVLNALGKKGMQLADPLAGTGIRGVRFFKELEKGIIKRIYFNDYSNDATKMIKKNLILNKVKSKFEITSKDANLFLLESKGFDYIDIDPFGCPNKFLDSSVERIARDGILAVTATDTGALCGTYPDVCIRKYWAKPLHNYEMHEVGIRILIRKVQMIGLQYEKALVPILSIDKDHYMRIFFRCEKSKKRCDDIASQHQFYNEIGPIWVGKLKDQKVADKIRMNDKFTELLKEELDILGFYEMDYISSKEKIQVPKISYVIDQIKLQGYKATRTTFCETGIKTDMPYDKLLGIIKK